MTSTTHDQDDVQVIKHSSLASSLDAVWQVAELAPDGSHWITYPIVNDRDEAEAHAARLRRERALRGTS